MHLEFNVLTISSYIFGTAEVMVVFDWLQCFNL